MGIGYKVTVIGVAVLATFSIMGCSLTETAVNTAVQKTTGVEIQKNGQGFKAKTSEGEVEVGANQNKLPEGFSKDLVYSGAEIAGSAKMKNAKNTTYQVIYKVDAPPEKISKFYKEILAKKGYKVTATFDNPKGFIFGISKGSENSGQVVCSLEQGKTAVNFSLQVK